MANEFYALISRMRYITRWGLMRNSFSENVQGAQPHGRRTGTWAGSHPPGHPGSTWSADPDRCAAAGLYHDASEILTGDLPTPVKYFNPEIKKAYKQVERVSGDKLLSMLPEALQPSYEHLIQEDDPETLPIVKAADKLSAYIKCVEELKAGNQEFESAARQTMQAMEAMGRPELDYFLREFLPAFSLNLDQLE